MGLMAERRDNQQGLGHYQYGNNGLAFDRCGSDAIMGKAFFDDKHNNGSKITFYFANIPDYMPLFRLRQYFEVCGILSDIYIARQFNSRGQFYGFVGFFNVRNKDKLAQDLNNVWIGDFKVWAREAKFDRFAQYDDDHRVSMHGDRRDENGGERRPVVRTNGDGVKNMRLCNFKKIEGMIKIVVVSF